MKGSVDQLRLSAGPRVSLNPASLVVALRKQGKALYTLIQFNAYIHTEVIRSPGAAALKSLDLKPKRTQTARMYVGAWESFVPNPKARRRTAQPPMGGMEAPVLAVLQVACR